MLRWLLIGLIVANLGFWALTQPLVSQALGLPLLQDGQREPERLTRQVRPETIQLRSGPEPATLARCLEAGPLNDELLDQATLALTGLGLRSDQWLDIRREQAGRWAVYMGPYPAGEPIRRKREELQRLRVNSEELTGHPSLSPGLTLGRYGTEAEAEDGLRKMQQSGVRTAKVVTLVAPAVEHRLRVESLAPALADRLIALPAETTPSWRTCAKP
ncbi:hypothetical protein [Ideonella sp.]|uniref:hypothetical protein n=1 Tax=Ideonella sp. TaxID=1929293 RepID=UPI003BB6A69B